jgi:hypothetical protein
MINNQDARSWTRVVDIGRRTRGPKDERREQQPNTERRGGPLCPGEARRERKRCRSIIPLLGLELSASAGVACY